MAKTSYGYIYTLIFMRHFLLLFLLTITSSIVSIAQDVQTLHETAKTYLRDNDYQNAILVLNRALDC